MKQQINLYQPLFHPQKNPLPATKMLLIAALVALVLLVVRSYLACQVEPFAKKLSQVRKEGEQLTKKVDELQPLMAPKQKSQLLENEIVRLGAEREAKGKLLDYLAKFQGGRHGGFSSYLEALARQKVDGLWLRRISFGSASGSMTLDGSATDPQLVPQYLHNLLEDGSLPGVEFSDFRIICPPGDERGVEFFMKTKSSEGKDEQP